MTNVIIVLAPWALFTAALAIILSQVCRPRRPRGRPPPERADPPQLHQPRPRASDDEPPVPSGEAAGPGQRRARL